MLTEFDEAAVPPAARGRVRDAALRRFRAHKPAMASAAVVLGLALVAVFGPMLAPWDYRIQDLDGIAANGYRPLPPLSPGHVLGTDALGRDLLSRMLDGARISMTVALIAQLAVIAIGVPVGAVAGWFGGRIDAVLMRVADVFYAFPDLLFIILVSVAFLGTTLGTWLDGLFVVFVAIGLISWVTMARLVRAQVLTLKEREYVVAARATGVSDLGIIVRHLVPNTRGPIVVAVSLGLPGAILAEATLSFLGVGVQAPRASWGSLINHGADLMVRHPHLVIFPGLAVALTLMAFTFLGDGVRDALDPSLTEKGS